MLEEKLEPLLSKLKKGKRERNKNYSIVREWFQEHQENLAESMKDLIFLCTLPDCYRQLVTYTVIGNYVLSQFEKFNPKTTNQENALGLLKKLILENRFNNSHTDDLYDAHADFNKTFDQLNMAILENPKDFMPLYKIMDGLCKKINKVVENAYSETPANELNKILSTDLGHGLNAPFRHFYYLTDQFRYAQKGDAPKLDLTIMVVDDQEPEKWYQRMIAVGFKDVAGQQGFFYDCETALEALKAGHYDVVLSDLELGKGKMSGIDFVKQAHNIQKDKGIKPAVSVFSYNHDLLVEAERSLRDLLFHQVAIFNNKTDFKAFEFRRDVECYLAR